MRPREPWESDVAPDVLDDIDEEDRQMERWHERQHTTPEPPARSPYTGYASDTRPRPTCRGIGVACLSCHGVGLVAYCDVCERDAVELAAALAAARIESHEVRP